MHRSENLHVYSFNTEEWPESIFTALPLVSLWTKPHAPIWLSSGVLLHSLISSCRWWESNWRRVKAVRSYSITSFHESYVTLSYIHLKSLIIVYNFHFFICSWRATSAARKHSNDRRIRADFYQIARWGLFPSGSLLSATSCNHNSSIQGQGGTFEHFLESYASISSEAADRVQDICNWGGKHTVKHTAQTNGWTISDMIHSVFVRKFSFQTWFMVLV